MSVTTASPDLHRIDEMTIALCRAAREASVEIPRSYAQRLVATSEGAGELGVSRRRRRRNPHRPSHQAPPPRDYWICG